MATSRRKPDPDGIVMARLADTANRHATREPLDVEAALAELREIAGGRSDLLARQAGLILGSRDSVGAAVDAVMWPRRALEAALLIAAGADLTALAYWIAEGQRRATRAR
jgi:hypothetical protein